MESLSDYERSYLIDGEKVAEDVIETLLEAEDYEAYLTEYCDYICSDDQLSTMATRAMTVATYTGMVNEWSEERCAIHGAQFGARLALMTAHLAAIRYDVPIEKLHQSLELAGQWGYRSDNVSDTYVQQCLSIGEQANDRGEIDFNEMNIDLVLLHERISYVLDDERSEDVSRKTFGLILQPCINAIARQLEVSAFSTEHLDDELRQLIERGA